jgi:hypothetical protein
VDKFIGCAGRLQPAHGVGDGIEVAHRVMYHE